MYCMSVRGLGVYLCRPRWERYMRVVLWGLMIIPVPTAMYRAADKMVRPYYCASWFDWPACADSCRRAVSISPWPSMVRCCSDLPTCISRSWRAARQTANQQLVAPAPSCSSRSVRASAWPHRRPMLQHSSGLIPMSWAPASGTHAGHATAIHPAREVHGACTMTSLEHVSKPPHHHLRCMMSEQVKLRC